MTRRYLKFSALRVSVLVGALALAGAALAQADEEALEPAEARSPASTEPDTKAVDRARPVVWSLHIDAPDALADLLGRYLDLARYKEASAQDGAQGIRRSELRRLVISAPDQARALLEAEGYFNARITTRVGDDVPDKPVQVTMKVEPGVRARISKVQFIYEGEFDNRLSSDERAAQGLRDRLEAAWLLPEGKVFRQSDWSSAKDAALARLRAEGYPLATWSGTSVTVDAATNEARLFLVADSGPAFKFGPIRVEGLVRQPASAVVNLAPFGRGEPYNDKQLFDWQERIQKLNLFDTVFVTTGLDPTQASDAPVIVQVHEMPMQAATTGIGVSSDTGPRVSQEYLHRNVLGLAWTAKLKAQLGRDESLGSIDLTSHPWPGRKRGLLSTQASRVKDSDGAITTAQQYRVGLLFEGERLERTNYLEWQRAKVRSEDGTVVSDATAASVTGQWVFRNVDSQTQPTKGTTTLAQLTGGRTVSALVEAGYFGRSYVRSTGYLPLPWNWRLIARAELGQVFARDIVSIPDTQLFRVGGDDSIRGYPYRSIGIEKEGVVTGGRSVATGSLEIAHPFVKSVPSVLGALFVDAGDAANGFGKLKANVGYGAGVRWLSPVGPLRLDAAYGVGLQRWRVHFTVGVIL